MNYSKSNPLSLRHYASPTDNPSKPSAPSAARFDAALPNGEMSDAG